MTDTQWPRFMVFQQSEPDKPFVHNGTVHAPDSEMALLNARDVFYRRPRAVSMWVVPADSIFSVTLEELENDEWMQGKKGDQKETDFHVFTKFTQQGQCEQLGEVSANSHEAAMEKAIATYKDKKVLWWWVFPAEAVLASDAEDTPSMYDPSLEFEYKNQADYPVVTMMRQIHSKGKLED